MAGSPNQNDQHRITLSRDERLAALAKIDPKKHPRAAGLTVGEWESLRRLCEAIELAHPVDGSMYVDTLASKCRWRRSNLLRVARLGRRVGVLVSSPQYDERGRAPNCWLVCWDRLAVWAGKIDPDVGRRSSDRRAEATRLAPTGAPVTHHPSDDRRRSAVDVDVGLTARAVGPTLQPVGLTARSVGPTGALEELLIKQTSSYLPDGYRVTEGARRPEEVFNFDSVEQLAYEAGVDQAAAAVRSAREQGCTPSHVAELVAHWRRHGGGEPYAAWGAAALCWRIQNARPNLPADRSWPRMSDAWQKHVERTRPQRQGLAAPKLEPVAARFEGSMLDEYQRLRRGG